MFFEITLKRWQIGKRYAKEIESETYYKIRENIMKKQSKSEVQKVLKVASIPKFEKGKDIKEKERTFYGIKDGRHTALQPIGSRFRVPYLRSSVLVKCGSVHAKGSDTCFSNEFL